MVMPKDWFIEYLAGNCSESSTIKPLLLCLADIKVWMVLHFLYFIERNPEVMVSAAPTL